MNHLRENQKIVIQTVIDAGLSPQTAKVIAANFTGESLAQPSQRGWDIKHYSQGIAQWSQDRAERIKAHFGKYPKDMSVEDQTKAFLWEAQRFYPKTWAALHNTKLSPKMQMVTIVRDFERPRNPFRAAQQRMKFYHSIQV